MSLDKSLIQKHSGKTIGILGSGPTLNDFKDNINDLCDVVIAVNGSVNSLNPNKHYVDYFMYYDIKAFKRDWFFKSRAFYQRPFIDFPILNLFGKKRTARISGGESADEYGMSDEMYYFKARKLEFNSSFGLNYEKGLIYNWCTVTGLAVQVAYFMGAKQINLFGSSFDNDSGQNYCYKAHKKDVGATYNHQRIAMDRVIKKVKQKGVDVVSYGETRLKEPKIIQLSNLENKGVYFKDNTREYNGYILKR